ncbi:MAG TPA: efflux RND transporter periplasmic adaptor subunit [Methylomirabilota bacterium]|nr:efflux RND transporter periplasmic adaptor subunit [Methylomirabilota bacterium]
MTDGPPDSTPPPIPAPAPPAAATPRHGLSRIAAILAVVIVVAAAGGYWYWQNGQPTEPAQAATAPPPPAVTVASPLHQEIVEWDEFTGQFAAVDYVEIRARVSGYLDEIHFTDGQIVSKGDLLFVIDPRPYQIALDSARAQLGEASARLDLANRQLSRAASLRKSDYVAASTYDERAQDVASATAAVETAKAAINAAELDLDFTHVTAPLTGRVGRHEVSLGNLISGGSNGATTLLTTIVSLDPIYLNFDVSESDLLAYQRAVASGRLKSPRDQPIGVFAHLPDETNWSLQGRLDFLSNQVDRTTGTIRARATFPNPGYLITPGQFGRVRIPASEPYQAILIPDDALVTDQSRKLVLTVDADGTVVPKVVRPGPKYDPLGLRIVRDGLDPSDRIIINGLMRARPGAKVTPTPGTIQPQPQS